MGLRDDFKPSTLFGIAIVFTASTFIVVYLLTSVFQHKVEAENRYLRLQNVTQATTDPAPWGINWPSEYDQYLRTSQASKTNFGGGDANPGQKSMQFPFLPRMFAGYAFALDYRDRRGHAFMLFDQEHTRRVTEKPQTGACLHCHSSVIPTYFRLGGGDPLADHYTEDIIRKGFEKLSPMPYWDAHAELEKTGSANPTTGQSTSFTIQAGGHPVSCTDCHNAQTMKLQVNRPGFVAGIRDLKASQGTANFDVNRDASRAEMRTYVCAQCHVEYYCGPKTALFFPWNKGLRVEEIESYYNEFKFPDGHRFFDWSHAETGTEMLKAQHPEFELWSQGIHAKSGVTCADCHMPYAKEGALKVSDHYVRSPLLMINRSCQQCHAVDADELKARVTGIQETTFNSMSRAGAALLEFLDTFKEIRSAFEQGHAGKPVPEIAELWKKHLAESQELQKILELHRMGQWRLDFIAAENSMGFHAPQEAVRILAESIDYLRQAQVLARDPALRR